MAGRRVTRVAVTALLLGVCMTGCASEDAGPWPSASPSPTSTTPAPTASASPSSTASRPLTSDEARAELQAYLDAWRTQGPAAAGQAYLVPDQQVTDDADAPRLTSGTVTEVGDPEDTSEGTVVQASLDLSFAGDPVAWSEGTNERFVRFTPRAGDIPWVMELATGP